MFWNGYKHFHGISNDSNLQTHNGTLAQLVCSCKQDALVLPQHCEVLSKEALLPLPRRFASTKTHMKSSNFHRFGWWRDSHTPVCRCRFTCIFMYVWIIPVSHFSSVLLRYCRSIQGAMFVKPHVSINLFQQGCTRRSAIHVFQQVPPPACSRELEILLEPKKHSITLHFGCNKKSLLTFFVGSKKTAFVETNIFLTPLDSPFLLVFRQFILGSWCWSGGLRKLKYPVWVHWT